MIHRVFARVFWPRTHGINCDYFFGGWNFFFLINPWFRMGTLPETNRKFAPENRPRPNRKGSYSNHPFFRGELLNFGRVVVSNMFYFHPDPCGRFPFWRAYFSKGWFNHQLVFFVLSFECGAEKSDETWKLILIYYIIWCLWVMRFLVSEVVGCVNSYLSQDSW